MNIITEKNKTYKSDLEFNRFKRRHLKRAKSKWFNQLYVDYTLTKNKKYIITKLTRRTNEEV